MSKRKSHVNGIKNDLPKGELDKLDSNGLTDEFIRAVNYNNRRLSKVALCVGLALGKKLNGLDFA